MLLRNDLVQRIIIINLWRKGINSYICENVRANFSNLWSLWNRKLKLCPASPLVVRERLSRIHIKKLSNWTIWAHYWKVCLFIYQHFFACGGLFNSILQKIYTIFYWYIWLTLSLFMPSNGFPQPHFWRYTPENSQDLGYQTWA